MKTIPLWTIPDDQRALPIVAGHIHEAPDDVLTAEPRRHNFYFMIWLTAGQGIHFIDFKGYAIQPQTLYFVGPYQIQYWEIEEAIDGYYIGFEDVFYRQSNFLSQLTLFSSLESEAALTFDADDARLMDVFLSQFAAEFKGLQQESFGGKEAVISLLQLILVHAQRRQTAIQQIEKGHTRNAGSQITHEFLGLVETHLLENLPLQAYADRLGITPDHLSDSVRRELGIPASRLLQQRLAIEAKRFLVHSDWTSAQIAEHLNFKDPSYFGRFFKRETGQSPRTFREQFWEKYQKSPEN